MNKISMLNLIADTELKITWEACGVLVAVFAAGSAWLYLPKQVADLEKRMSDLEVTKSSKVWTEAIEHKVDLQQGEIKQLGAVQAASNSTLAELKISIGFMREQIAKIAVKLDVN